jgi:hypothetical protein
MILPLKDQKISREKVDELSNQFAKLSLGELVKEVRVQQGINQRISNFEREYRIELEFEPTSLIMKAFKGVSIEHIKSVVKDNFIPILLNNILRMIKSLSTKDDDEVLAGGAVAPEVK